MVLSQVLETPADVIDGEILFSQADDLLAPIIFLLQLGGRSFGWGNEELPFGVLPELMTEDQEASGGVAESLGDFVFLMSQCGCQDMYLSTPNVDACLRPKKIG